MNFKQLALLSGVSLTSAAIQAQDLTIEITNLTHGIHFTPLLATAHNGDNHLFMSGMPASAELQMMAEGGDISGLVTIANGIAANSLQNPAAGLLAPGMSTSGDLSTTDGNMYLSIVGMLLPTNDGFVGVDSWPIPSAAGTYTFTMNAYDAGTEANDELITGGGAPGAAGIPIAPASNGGTGGTGVTTEEANTRVHIHRGVLGDSDLTGGSSDLDSRVHRWLNPVAKVTVTVK